MIKKLKDSQFLSDRLTLTLAMLCIVFSIAVTNVLAAGNSGNSGQGVPPHSISDMSAVLTRGFNSLINDILVKADEGRGGSTTWKTYLTLFDDYMSISTVGNYLGVETSRPDQTSQGASEQDIWTRDGAAPMRSLDLMTVSKWYIDAAEPAKPSGATSAKAYADWLANKGNKIQNSAICQYIVFGSTLNAIGIDEVSTADGTSGGLAGGLRALIGYACYICYILAYTASGLMQEVLNGLLHLNIFSYIQTMDAGGTSTELFSNSNFLTRVYGVYTGLKGLRWVFIGLSIVLYVASVTVWKSKAMGVAATNQQRLRNIMYRIIIASIGIPLLGMIYMESLGIIQAEQMQITDRRGRLNDYIFSQFVDFDLWSSNENSSAFKIDSTYTGGASYWHTGMPSNIVIGTGGGLINTTEDAEYSKIHTALDTATGDLSWEINGAPYDAAGMTYVINKGLYGTTIVNHSVNEVLQGTSIIRAITNNTNDDGTIASYAETADGGTETDLEAAYTTCRSLMMRYAHGDKVNPVRYSNDGDYATLTVALGQATGVTDMDAFKRQAVTLLFSDQGAENEIWSYFGQLQVPLDTNNVIKIDGEDTHTIKINDLAAKGGTGLQLNIDGTSTSLFENTLGSNGHEITVSGSYDESILKYDFELKDANMSTLALFNYMNTSFESGTMTVFTPALQSNEGVATMHYSVTTPYTGITEVCQLLYTTAMLFCMGIVGWVFAVSMLMNIIVETIKMVPSLFKTAIGSIAGFVEGIVTVFAVIIEIFITVLLYDWALDIVDFFIQLARSFMAMVIGIFGMDAAVQSTVSNILTILIILWATFQLIRWRKAAILSLKSIITHAMNQVFGTKVAMPTGASSGMLGAAALAGAGLVGAHALASDGSLEDVVNDIAGGNKGSELKDGLMDSLNDVKDDLQKGDVAGAIADAKEGIENAKSGFTDGGVDRGANATSDAEAAEKAAGDNGFEGANPFDEYGRTDEQNAELDAVNNDDSLTDKEKAKKLEKLNNKFDKENFGNERNADAYRQDYKDGNINSQADVEKHQSKKAKSKTAEKLAEKYDANGLTAEQAEAVDEMVDNGATEQDVAEAVDGYAQQNFGEDYAETVDAINEGAGREEGATYGSGEDYGYGKRKMSVSSKTGENGQRGYTVAGNDDEALEFEGAGSGAAAGAGAGVTQVGSGTANAKTMNANGLYADQQAVIDQMVDEGATDVEVAAAIDGYAQSNLGSDYASKIEAMNAGANRSGSVTYGSGQRRIQMAGSSNASGEVQYEVTDTANGNVNASVVHTTEDAGAGQVTYTAVDAGGKTTGSITTADASTIADMNQANGYSGAVYDDFTYGSKYQANNNVGATMIKKANGGTGRTLNSTNVVTVGSGSESYGGLGSMVGVAPLVMNIPGFTNPSGGQEQTYGYTMQMPGAAPSGGQDNTYDVNVEMQGGNAPGTPGTDTYRINRRGGQGGNAPAGPNQQQVVYTGAGAPTMPDAGNDGSGNGMYANVMRHNPQMDKPIVYNRETGKFEQITIDRSSPQQFDNYAGNNNVTMVDVNEGRVGTRSGKHTTNTYQVNYHNGGSNGGAGGNTDSTRIYTNRNSAPGADVASESDGTGDKKADLTRTWATAKMATGILERFNKQEEDPNKNES